MNLHIFFYSARTRSCAHDGCNPSNCHDSTHKHRLSNQNKAFGNTLSPDDHNDIMNAFSDSCRLESISPESHSVQVQQLSPIGAPHHNLYGIGSSASIHTSQSSHSQSQSGRPILHYTHGNVLTTATGSNQSSLMEKRSDVNLHQKLQRQLSLNPNDPRLLRMHNANSLQSKHSQHAEQIQQESSQIMQHTGHRQLAPSHSGPRTHMTNHWDLHQVCFHITFYGCFCIFNIF